MGNADLIGTLTETVKELSEPFLLKRLFHQPKDGTPLPSGAVLQEIVELLRAIIFPEYYGKSLVNINTVKFYIGANIERLHRLLSDQIQAGLCFACSEEDEEVAMQTEGLCGRAEEFSVQLITLLPRIRKTLATDVTAAYKGDPAAKSYEEVILCYPVIKALTNYRVAHELLKMGIPFIPRMLTEMAHSETGIDIHPGAEIGRYFTIDHGTGVVIGATCIIGDNVKLYQGVTLGARSFPLDAEGRPIKGIPRHPILRDNVVIYSNATLLGRITIGEGCVIGANIWVTEDIEPYTKIFKKIN